MVENIKTIFGIILLLGLIALLIYVWITPIKTVEPDEDSKIESLEKIDGDTTIKIFIDEKTGVNYLIYDSYKKGGITPRFNADGSLYIE